MSNPAQTTHLESQERHKPFYNPSEPLTSKISRRYPIKFPTPKSRFFDPPGPGQFWPPGRKNRVGVPNQRFPDPQNIVPEPWEQSQTDRIRFRSILAKFKFSTWTTPKIQLSTQILFFCKNLRKNRKFLKIIKNRFGSGFGPLWGHFWPGWIFK